MVTDHFTSLGTWADTIIRREPRKRAMIFKMDLQDVGRGGMDWIDLAQARKGWHALVNAIRDLRGSIKCGQFLD